MADRKVQDQDLIFALDIGTRSVVGVVGRPVGDRLKVIDVEMAEHGKRAMMDGQIDDIKQVGALARTVTERLETRLGVHLERVCVAAAGRALRTQKGSFTLELPEEQSIDAEQISRLEAGAVSAAEEALQSDGSDRRQMFLVGYTVAQYRLDNYPMANLQYHTGRKAEADVVATFLPGEVVESLYAAMRNAGLQVSSMTLEPIAAMNAAIPAELRLLNLAMVDIGAGTTDIALCRDGSVVGYTMATVAGDEVTEAIMRSFLVDFRTAEEIKRSIGESDELIRCRNILGQEERVAVSEVVQVIQEPMDKLADAIAKQILGVNGTPPSAVFLAGGGSKLAGLREKVAIQLEMAPPAATPWTAAPVPAARPAPRPQEVHLTLNGRPLVLPRKEDGSPYYLMDLLEHSGIDFEHLDRTVRLEVNGVERGFQHTLKEQDSVSITLT